MKTRGSLWVWFAALVAIVMGTVVLLIGTGKMRLAGGSPGQPEPTGQQLPPTPTPLRPLSSVATNSAFVKLESDVASISRQTAELQIIDPSLSPPTLDLELGFE